MENIDITGVRYSADDQTKKYVIKKEGNHDILYPY